RRASDLLAERRPLLDQGPQAPPVEQRSGIGLALGRDVAVAHDVLGAERGVSVEERRGQPGELPVLRLRVRRLVRPLELDPDREVVAVLAAVVLGLPGMPGARAEGHVLNDLAVAAYER